VSGSTALADSEWIMLLAHQLAKRIARIAREKTHLIIDHGTKYRQGLRQILESAGVQIVI